MTAQEIIAAIQGGVISVSFLLSILSAPKMFVLWAAYRKEMEALAHAESEKVRIFESAEREADRAVRREDSRLLTEAVNALRSSLQLFCRFNQGDKKHE